MLGKRINTSFSNLFPVFFLIFDLIFSFRSDAKQASWCEIWDGKPSKIYLFAVHYAWSVYVLLFNCVVLNIRAYGRDHLSINTVAIGFSEIVGVFIGMYLVLYTSRRWLWAGVIAITCGCLAYFTWLIPETCKSSKCLSLICTCLKF